MTRASVQLKLRSASSTQALTALLDTAHQSLHSWAYPTPTSAACALVPSCWELKSHSRVAARISWSSSAMVDHSILLRITLAWPILSQSSGVSMLSSLVAIFASARTVTLMEGARVLSKGSISTAQVLGAFLPATTAGLVLARRIQVPAQRTSF